MKLPLTHTAPDGTLIELDQTWESTDIRELKRTLVVTGFENHRTRGILVLLRNTANNRITRVKVRRMKAGSSGFRLVTS